MVSMKRHAHDFFYYAFVLKIFSAQAFGKSNIYIQDFFVRMLLASSLACVTYGFIPEGEIVFHSIDRKHIRKISYLSLFQFCNRPKNTTRAEEDALVRNRSIF